MDGTGNGSTTTPDEGDDNNTEEKPDQGGNTGGESTDNDEEDKPADTAITISDNGTGYLENGVTVTGGEYPTDVAVVMNVPNGIKNVYVKITSTDTVFQGMVSGMGLVEEDGMDLVSEDASTLAKLFPLPEKGAQNYTFTMSDELFFMLDNFSGIHSFSLRVVDANGNEESAKLTINN